MTAAGRLPPLPRPIRDASDQPDEAGAQVHLVYVLPSDEADRALDVNGTIEGSVASSQAWLATQAGGRALRIDTAGRNTRHQLPAAHAVRCHRRAQGAFVRDPLEDALAAAGFTAPDKIYIARYDGLAPLPVPAAAGRR